MEPIVRPVCNLTQEEITRMLRLMREYYLNVNDVEFRNDLFKKDKVILLMDNGELCGFSTWMQFRHICNEQQVNIIYSGDTITDADHRNSMALPVAWGNLMASILDQDSHTPLFWLLTSKGYKTYRFLPVFFKTFFPSYRCVTPDFERSLMISLARQKFGDKFDPETQVVRVAEGSQCLRPGVGDITPTRLRDEHVDFFYKSNPNYGRGDELVCLARCSRDNIRPFILRQL
jgi:hypothetical protein